mmetsp:Transcript_16765/g.43295  ORF Transcript_16765/g.43295 Transcript_16765/m.43295 type:complete len:221 (+) Transcript_16765:118-780(+)
MEQKKNVRQFEWLDFDTAFGKRDEESEAESVGGASSASSRYVDERLFAEDCSDDDPLAHDEAQSTGADKGKGKSKGSGAGKGSTFKGSKDSGTGKGDTSKGSKGSGKGKVDTSKGSGGGAAQPPQVSRSEGPAAEVAADRSRSPPQRVGVLRAEVGMQGPWQRLESRSSPGNFYYFHDATGVSQAEPPPPWEKRESRSQPGVGYYWNPQTAETCTEKPRL